MEQLIRAIARHYDRLVVESGRQPQFFIFTSFLLTFLAVRAVTHAIRAGRGRWILRNVAPGGRHIHHLVWGILLLLVTGYLAFAFDPRTGREPLAILFGVGAALTLDEFALWLNLEDVYWSRQGRRSVDAVLITGAMLGLVLVGGRLWIEVAREAGRFLNVL